MTGRLNRAIAEQHANALDFCAISKDNTHLFSEPPASGGGITGATWQIHR